MSSEKVTEVHVPDLGGADQVDVIEVSVSVGDHVDQEATIITLESDKATIEVPSPISGTVKEIITAVGQSVSQGDLILRLSTSGDVDSDDADSDSSDADEPVQHSESFASAAPAPKASESSTIPDKAPLNAEPLSAAQEDELPINRSKQVHAGPAVRRLANELGVDLAQVEGHGPKQRILKEDVHQFVKQTLSAPKAHTAPSAGGVPELPKIDFSQWGSTESVALTKIQRTSATNLHRSWVTIPHVTQFDEADITELHAFRKAESVRLKDQGVKLTPLAFIIKAVTHALMQFPKFNASLSTEGDTLIYKHYYHIGFAVDTPNGLVVPVVRDVDRLSVTDIARELQRLSEKARDKKLTPNDMQGGCFTVSSLGGIGGTQFTPIVNWPEVAILGVSKAASRPVYHDDILVPRLIMPFSLSYDHRVIDGADAVRFTTYLSALLSDIRRVLL